MSRRDTETVEARIGAHVKARRLQLGLTQADVAEAMQRLGHSWIQTTVAKTEAADRPLRVNELADLAQVLGERLRHLVSSSNDWTLEAVQVELEQSMMHANRLRSDVEEL